MRTKRQETENWRVGIAVTASTRSQIDKLMNAPSGSFRELAIAAELNPFFDFIGGYLSDVDLSGEDLRDFDFHDAVFENCRLTRTKLLRSGIEGANFERCNLDDALIETSTTNSNRLVGLIKVGATAPRNWERAAAWLLAILELAAAGSPGVQAISAIVELMSNDRSDALRRIARNATKNKRQIAGPELVQQLLRGLNTHDRRRIRSAVEDDDIVRHLETGASTNRGSYALLHKYLTVPTINRLLTLISAIPLP